MRGQVPAKLESDGQVTQPGSNENTIARHFAADRKIQFDMLRRAGVAGRLQLAHALTASAIHRARRCIAKKHSE
jgi:hypothetical protein